MSKSYEQAARVFWSLPQKPAEERNRDRLFRDDQILHDHLEREIARHLPGAATVLDAGGGTGRFSVWLAGRGLRVTHLDLSEPMLQAAREHAEAAGVAERITFVHGSLTQLDAYADGQFDLVLSLDAPVSYTYPQHNEVVRELVRVAAQSVVLCVASRTGCYPNYFQPAAKMPFLVDPHDPDGAVRWYVREWERRERWEPGFPHADRLLAEGLFDSPDEVMAQLERGGTPWPVTYAYRPEELGGVMREAGLHDVRLAGPGALARTLPGDLLRKLLETDAYREPFLERCYRFDAEPSVCGLGFCSLVASGTKR